MIAKFTFVPHPLAPQNCVFDLTAFIATLRNPQAGFMIGSERL